LYRTAQFSVNTIVVDVLSLFISPATVCFIEWIFKSLLLATAIELFQNKTSSIRFAPLVPVELEFLLYYPRLARDAVTPHVLDVDIHKDFLFATMSAPRTARTIFSDSPFATFNTPEDTQVGAEEFFQDPENFTFALPPYRLTNADVAPTPGGPFLTVFPGEQGPSTLKHTPETSPSIYFLMHPAIYCLMPFVWVPARIQRTDPG
jgi:hypothetical protein